MLSEDGQIAMLTASVDYLSHKIEQLATQIQELMQELQNKKK
jgi:hypothetical protein